MSRSRGVGDQTGFSLIELLITVAIMGICIIGLFQGLAIYYKGSSTQRSVAQLDQAIRTYSENLISASYTDCATSYSSVVLPSGYSFASAPTVRYWNSDNPATFVSTCSSDTGLQQITATIKEDSSSATQTLKIAKAKS